MVITYRKSLAVEFPPLGYISLPTVVTPEQRTNPEQRLLL